MAKQTKQDSEFATQLITALRNSDAVRKQLEVMFSQFMEDNYETAEPEPEPPARSKAPKKGKSPKSDIKAKEAEIEGEEEENLDDLEIEDD